MKTRNFSECKNGHSRNTICQLLEVLYFEMLHQDFLKMIMVHPGVGYYQPAVERNQKSTCRTGTFLDELYFEKQRQNVLNIIVKYLGVE